MLEEYLLELLIRLSDYEILISAVAPFILGDVSLHIIGILSGEGILTPWVVILIPTLSTIFIESFVLYLVRYKNIIGKILKGTKKEKLILEKIEHIRTRFHGQDVPVLIISKFLPGSRLITMVYLGVCKLPFVKFLIIESVLVIAWVVLIVGSGFLVGNKILPSTFSESLDALLLYIGAFILVFIGISYLLNRYIDKVR